MQGFADNFIPVIAGDILHPADKPWCYDPMCPCKENNEEEVAILNSHLQEGHLTPQEATNIVAGKTV